MWNIMIDIFKAIYFRGMKRLARLAIIVNGTVKMKSQIELFQKKSTSSRRMGFWKFLLEGGGGGEGGSKTLQIQAGEGIELEKVFCRGHLDR